MQVKTAAKLYDLGVSYLRLLCTRGVVKATLVGGRYFITPAEMDRVFKGVEAPKAKGTVASTRATKLRKTTK